MNSTQFILLALVILFVGCKSSRNIADYKTETIEIKQLTKQTFLHTTFLATKSYGKVPCNGMIVIDNGEAIIFDTPTDDAVSTELINWIEKELKCNVKGIVVTHFHVDCLGGLEAFHNLDIPSYASSSTIDFAQLKEEPLPQNGFEKVLELGFGNEKVICEFIGEGHTKDNIVAYFPSDHVLFGGCLIKSDGAGKGNLNDANVEEWSNTVQKVKSKFGEVKVVIPGHGKPGGQELLDYTIQLFSGE